ncbi:hypothetical protein PIB30_091161 [Stylosanthes scabra]|uniref:Gnk2-homologous domain-containing protein n=1 Tax=Stylosanthes scabra TaxID=79078 RepID=A0ABU6WUF4_9FABA|nr:hypothetical protein [Stylosanthes scabra]
MIYGLDICRGDISSELCGECVGNTKTFHKHRVFTLRSGSYVVRRVHGKVLQHVVLFARDGGAWVPWLRVGEPHQHDGPTKLQPFICTSDLSLEDCISCLDGLINSNLPECRAGKQGGRVLYSNCNIRFEIYLFYRTLKSATPAPALHSNSEEFSRLLSLSENISSLIQSPNRYKTNSTNLKTLPNKVTFRFNLVQALDSVGLRYFTRIFNWPASRIGPVFLSIVNGSRGKGGDINVPGALQRVAQQETLEFRYVCFGPMNTISTSQMMQLGTTLERCGRSFVWVARPPIVFDKNAEFRNEEWLPEGFANKVLESGRRLIVHNWMLQVEIPSHWTVSAFMSHCGCNSVVESLSVSAKSAIGGGRASFLIMKRRRRRIARVVVVEMMDIGMQRDERKDGRRMDVNDLLLAKFYWPDIFISKFN